MSTNQVDFRPQNSKNCKQEKDTYNFPYALPSRLPLPLNYKTPSGGPPDIYSNTMQPASGIINYATPDAIGHFNDSKICSKGTYSKGFNGNNQCSYYSGVNDTNEPSTGVVQSHMIKPSVDLSGVYSDLSERVIEKDNTGLNTRLVRRDRDRKQENREIRRTQRNYGDLPIDTRQNEGKSEQTNNRQMLSDMYLNPSGNMY
jgi:hypothetical protein